MTAAVTPSRSLRRSPHGCERASFPLDGYASNVAYKCNRNCNQGMPKSRTALSGPTLRFAWSGGCGGYEIRTREGLPPTRFPTVRVAVRGRSQEFTGQVRGGARTVLNGEGRRRTGQRPGQRARSEPRSQLKREEPRRECVTTLQQRCAVVRRRILC